MGDFSPQGIMAWAGLSVFPVLVWFCLRRQTVKLALFGGLLLLMFARGTLELLGVSSVLMRLSTEGVALVCLVIALTSGRSRGVRLPGVFSLAAFVAVACVTVLMERTNAMLVIAFLRDYLFAVLFIYAAINVNFNDYERRVLTKLLIYLFISQIAANVVKLIVLGGTGEPYIGTMAILGGSLTTIFALTGAVACISLYLTTGRARHFILLLGFIAFAIIGEKRAIIVYLPFVYVTLLFVDQLQKGFRLGRALKQLLLLTMASMLLLYVAVRLIPTLNPEHRAWGPFDIAYATDYGVSYASTGAGAVEVIGRSQAPAYLVENVAADSMINLMFGYGAGHLVKSSFNDLAEGLGSQADISMFLYGVGYGARTAFLQLFLQVGLVGVALYMVVWARIFRSALRSARRRNVVPIGRRLSTLVIVGLAAIFTIDFLSYSVVSTQLGPVSVAMAFMFVLLRFGGERSKGMTSL